MNEEKRVELLLDHYKDTFQHILMHWKVRNRLFVFVLVIIAFMALGLYSPGSLSDLINAYIIKTLGEKAPKFEFEVIGSVVWFLLLSLVIQYYQRSILVDRQYRYIQNLEEQICSDLGGDYVTREGKAYFSSTGKAADAGKQPLFIRTVGPLYVTIFPLLLIIFVSLKIVHENVWPKSLVDWSNILVGLAVVAYNIFYMIWVRFRK